MPQQQQNGLPSSKAVMLPPPRGKVYPPPRAFVPPAALAPVPAAAPGDASLPLPPTPAAPTPPAGWDSKLGQILSAPASTTPALPTATPAPVAATPPTAAVATVTPSSGSMPSAAASTSPFVGPRPPAPFVGPQPPASTEEAANAPAADSASMPSAATPATFESVAPAAAAAEPSALEKIYAQMSDRQKALVDLQGKPPTNVQPSNWERLGAVISAFGIGMKDPAKAMENTEQIVGKPQRDATDRWQKQVDAAKEDLAGTMENVKLGLDVDRSKSEDAARQSTADFQKAETGRISDELVGGPEKRKLAAETDDRNQRADALAAAKVDPQIVAEFRATGQMRDIGPKSEVELSMLAHQVGPDGKPTPQAIQAAKAHKDIVDSKIKEIVNTRDPNEQTKLLLGLGTQLQNERNNLQTNLEKLQAVNFDDDPKSPQSVQIAQMQKTIDGIDADIAHVRETTASKIPGFKSGPAAGTPGGTPSGTQSSTPPGPPAAGMKWQQSSKTGAFRQVPDVPKKQ